MSEATIPSSPVEPKQSEVIESAPYTEKEAFQRLLDEKKKESEKRKMVEMELASIKEQTLKEQNRFKELYEQKAKEVEELGGKITNFEKSVIDAKKKSSLLAEMQKAGLKEEGRDLLLDKAALDRIIIHNDAGGTVTGAAELAREYSQKYPSMFGASTPSVSHAAPVGMQNDLDLEAWKKLPRDEQLKTYSQVRAKVFQK